MSSEWLNPTRRYRREMFPGMFDEPKIGWVSDAEVTWTIEGYHKKRNLKWCLEPPDEFFGAILTATGMTAALCFHWSRQLSWCATVVAATIDFYLCRLIVWLSFITRQYGSVAAALTAGDGGCYLALATLGVCAYKGWSQSCDVDARHLQKAFHDIETRRVVCMIGLAAALWSVSMAIRQATLHMDFLSIGFLVTMHYCVLFTAVARSASLKSPSMSARTLMLQCRTIVRMCYQTHIPGHFYQTHIPSVDGDVEAVQGYIPEGRAMS